MTLPKPVFILLSFLLMASFSRGQSGGMAWFDAPTESYVDLGSTNGSNCFSNLQNGDQLTVTMWVKWDDKNAQNVGNWANRLTYADSTGNGDNGTFWCQHDQSNDRFEFAIQTNNGRDYIYSTTQPQEGQWYHVAQVYDGWQMRIYVNGTQESSAWKFGDLNVSDASKLNMGRWPNAANNHRYFDGALDEISVWDRALSQQEILDIMNNPESVTGTNYDANGLIGYWDFDNYSAEDKSSCNNQGSGGGNFTTVPVGSEVTRTTASGDCNDPNNWDNGVPNDSMTAIVEDSMFLTQKTRAKNLILEDSLNCMGDTLVIEGDLIHKGEFIPSGGVLEFNGSTTDIRRILAQKPLTVSRMHVDVPSEVSLDSGILRLKEELRMVSGTLDVDKKRITLLSDSTGTARIARLPSNSLIKGQIAVQRWIPAGNAGWIDMAAPNRDSVTLEEWDDDLYLSGKTTGGFNDGCSWGSNCFWSVKRSDSTGALSDVTSTSTPLENGRGYELFIGDNGGVNVMNSDTTVTVKGRIKEPGTFTIDVNDNEWSLIANPFASPVDFDQIGLNNVDPYYYVAAATGSYEWYNRNNGNSSHSEVGPIISSSQGFWVIGNGNNASVTFQQSHKSAASASFAKNGENENMTLSLTDLSNGLSSRILLMAGMGSSEASEVKHKATPVLGAPDLFTTGRDSGKVRSKVLDERNPQEEIPLKVVPASQGTFSFSAKGLDALPYRQAILEDRAKDRRYELEEKGVVQVELSPSDSGNTRFFLHLSDEPSSLVEEKENAPIEIRAEGSTILLRSKGTRGEHRLSVHDASGRKVRKSEALRLDGDETRIRTDLAKGIYFVRLQSPDRSFTEKIFLGASR